MKNKANTPNTNAGANNENKMQFEKLLLEYELAYINGDYEKELQTLATCVTHSVLKKCINVSYNESLVGVKRDVVADTHKIASIDRLNNSTYRLKYNKDGDLVREVINKDNEKALNKITREALGDGADLVNVAIIEILEQTREHGPNLEIPYTKRVLNRKVWIKVEDSVNGWKDETTSGIREVYKAVRRAIESSRAVQANAKNGYTYLEEVVTDEDGNEDEVQTVYRRLDKYADLGGYATDFNGACTLYSASAETVYDTDELIEMLNLTERQAQVLKLRMRGYGQKAIATYLGVSKQAIQKTQKQMQAKVMSLADENSNIFNLDTINKYMNK